MSRKSKSLPIEILDKIFQHLPQESLKECQKVCQLWYSHATRHFMNCVHLNENNITSFLECQPGITSVVKILKIVSLWENEAHLLDDETNVLSKENVEQLLKHVPNLQELEIRSDLLPLCHLNNIDLPTSLKSINIPNCNFNNNNSQNVREFIKLLINLRHTIQKFNIIIYHKPFEKLDMVEFFGSFPKLIELDTTDMGTSIYLADCFQIIQAIPSLKSITFYMEEDIDNRLNNPIQFKQKLATLEKLEVTSNTFLPRNFSLIVHNFVGLKEINVTFEDNFIENLNHSNIFLEFLDFIYSIDTHDVEFKTNYEFYAKCLSNNITNTFTQPAKNNQKVSKHLYIDSNLQTPVCNSMLELNDTPELNDKFGFRLKSYRDYCNRLQRILKWDFICYNETLCGRLFDCLNLRGISDVETFTFKIISSRCFDFFFEMLSLLKGLKKVVLITQYNLKWLECKSFNQLDHITSLEIHLKLHIKELFPLEIFPNLKTLRLIRWFGVWHPKQNKYSLEQPLLNLESLHMDIYYLTGEAEYFNNKSFKLIVETNNLLHLYDVSVTSLYPTKIMQVKPENMQVHDYDDCIQLYIKVQSLQNLHLFVYDPKLGPYSDYSLMLSPSYYTKEALILL